MVRGSSDVQSSVRQGNTPNNTARETGTIEPAYPRTPAPKLTGKRVLLIAPQPFFTNRGTPINVKAMAESLARHGAAVDLLVYPFGESTNIPQVEIFRAGRIPGVRHVRIGPSWGKVLLDGALLASALRRSYRQRYDIFHGVEEGAFIAGILSQLHRRPYIFDLDSNMREQLRDSGFFRSRPILGFFGGLENYFLKRAAAVLTVCQSLTDFAREHVPHDRILQLEDFPVDSSTLVDSQLLVRLQQEHQAANRRFAVYTGNLEYYQGIDLFIQSFARMLKENPSSPSATPHALIVGGKPQDIRRCESLARNLGIFGGEKDAISFVGERPGEEMGTFLALADVVVSPRLHGTNTPLKIFSYMVSGAPVVATRILSHTQILSDNDAFLAEPNEIDFSAALTQAFDLSETAARMRSTKVQNARRLIDEKYNRTRFEREIVELYSRLLLARPLTSK